MNASTSSPGDPTVRGLPGADALPAAARSQKNSKEGGGRFVVESNRVAKVRRVEVNIISTIEQLEICLPVFKMYHKLQQQLSEKRFELHSAFGCTLIYS